MQEKNTSRISNFVLMSLPNILGVKNLKTVEGVQKLHRHTFSRHAPSHQQVRPSNNLFLQSIVCLGF